MEPEDRGLVEEARRGSQSAFSQLLRLHQAHVRAFLGRYTRHPDVVDDLAQETFLTAYRSLETYRGDSAFRIWLLGIARHRALMHLREEQRRRSQEGDRLDVVLPRLMAARLDSEGSAVSEHERRLSALKSCLRKLPEGSASLLRAHYFDGRSAGEIARSTGRTEAAIWIALWRIRQALRECMGLELTASGERS